MMITMMVFALSYRPFNTGGFAEDKRRIMKLMVGREEPDTFEVLQDSFGKRSGMTRDGLGMPMTNPPFGSFWDVWERIPETYQSSNEKELFQN